ncbi:prephenate dehydratase [Dethiobacter alkaliphilus]|uniref:Prephenate dehydratase n=1 Tax=Dethiobacter alkaliphilus AHT 1 TaxID=555088 RepID=C0GJD2_DETAL|nr:prephenate dehydratase [Dethiobacter alkaliphilus]EEG76617.1 Prephenate dehydratase [Dethiobacter alkaliphilus AHT 1]
MSIKIAYLGPAGTFSEEAAECFANKASLEAELEPCATVADCAGRAEDDAVKYAVVPLENSLEGSVHATLDVLMTSLELSIQAELVLDIEHNLLCPHKEMGQISQVYSHPQALAQCRDFLRQRLPQARLVPALSTAEAAAQVAREQSGAAIASKRAAKRYGLHILAENIQDSENRTRFIVLGKETPVPALPQKASLVFSVTNAAGSLFRVLQAFADHGVNLTRIESRPARKQLGDYIFFVDLDGTPDDINVKKALRQAAKEAVVLKLLGSYPVLP